LTLETFAREWEAAVVGAGAIVPTGGDPGDFGVTAPGRLGELGQELHMQWAAALAARASEVATQHDHLAAAAVDLRSAIRRYVAADELRD
jgi:hypothetical protein